MQSEALDRDEALLEEVKNAVQTFAEAVSEKRKGRNAPGVDHRSPRPK
jgi:hypothetical protein